MHNILVGSDRGKKNFFCFTTVTRMIRVSMGFKILRIALFFLEEAAPSTQKVWGGSSRDGGGRGSDQVVILRPRNLAGWGGEGANQKIS